MTAPLQKFVIAAVTLLMAIRTFGQVYSQAIYASGVSYYGDHCIGSAPFRFGFGEYSYSTDARGFIIMFSPERTSQPGDTFHRRTQIYLGPASFSVPIRPLPLFLVAGVVAFVVLGLADIAWKHLRRRRYETRVA